MNSADLPGEIVWALVLACASYALTTYRILSPSRRYDALLWWPIVLYIPGPLAAYFLLASHPIFINYFTPFSILAATSILISGYVIYLAFFSKSVSGRLEVELRTIEGSPVNNGNSWPYYALGLLCMISQLFLIRETGASLLSGAYVLGDGKFAENSALFTATAGLYEIFVALVGIKFATTPRKLKDEKGFWLFSFLVIFLRIFGGTRLVVVKVAAFTLLVALLKGNLKITRLLFIGGIALSTFMAIGALRGSESEDGALALFLVFAEPALGSLSATYIVDMYAESSKFFLPEFLWNGIGYIIFVLIHLAPNFIYQAFGGELTLLGDWGYYRTLAEPFYPFREILRETGLETISPVGGQSIVALGVAMFGVGGAPLIIPAIFKMFELLSRSARGSIPILLIAGFEAPSIFRDSTEILVKQVFIISIAYYAFYALCNPQLISWLIDDEKTEALEP